MSETNVYQTVSGTIFRVTTSADGHRSVEELKGFGWVKGPIGMVDLRVVEGTRRLSKLEIEGLERTNALMDERRQHGDRG
jgi:hypothetical protein